MEQMQAAQFRSFGGPDVLEVTTVLRPVAGPGEVLVRVDAAGVNRHDTFLREGSLRMITGRKFPMGLGLDFAGEVVARGPQAGNLAVGTRVWGMVSPKKGHVTGSAAQYVTVPANRLSPFPERLSMIEAASMVTPGETAVRALRDVAQAQRGERLLVRGAAGGVGMAVVQLAHALGTHVTALASADDTEFVAQCGADDVHDYRRVHAEDIGPFDVIIDTVGRGMMPFRRRLDKRGRMVTINFGSATAMATIALSSMYGTRRIRTFSGYPDSQLLADITRYVETGAMRPIVDSVYPLSRIVDAHRALAASRRPGRLVLTTTN